MESVLAESPHHRGLLLAATQGFVQYTYAYVELRADELEDKDLQAAYAQRERARRLYGAGRRFVFVNSAGEVQACPFCAASAGSCLEDPLDEVLKRVVRFGCHAYPLVS